MDRLRGKFLNVPLDTVIHPASAPAVQASRVEKAAASAAPTVKERELTAQEWFEKGYNARDSDEKLRFYTEAIRLKPDYVIAFNNRGLVRSDEGDLDGAIKDYTEAIRLKPDYADAFNNRGVARFDNGDLDGAMKDYEQAIQLKPNDEIVVYNRAEIWEAKANLPAAIGGYQRYLDLGGGKREGDTKEVKQKIRDLLEKL